MLFVYLGWSITGSMQYDRELHTAIRLVNGQMLVTGGKAALREILNTAELYDPSAGIWTAFQSMNYTRHSSSAVLLTNGKVLV